MIKKSLKILIVDDHDVVIHAVKQAILDIEEDSVIDTSESFTGAVQKVSQSPNYDLLILDIGIPGTENHKMIEIFRSVQANLRILIFTGLEEDTHAVKFLTAGANGFLSKSVPFERIKLSIQVVLNDNVYISSEVQKMMMSYYSNNSSQKKTMPKYTLSPRETEVMDLLIKGKLVTEIATELRLKITTVSTHKARIFQKMEVENIIDLFKKVKKKHYSL